MIQDIMPHRYNNAYQAKKPDKNSRLLYFMGKQVLLKRGSAGHGDGVLSDAAGAKEQEIEFPVFEDVEQDNGRIYDDAVYLFSIDGEEFYLAKDVEWRQDRGLGLEDTGIFRGSGPKHMAFAGVTGYQLYRWYGSRQYCGRCGAALVHSDKERMMQCPRCGCMEYPKLCPAVIVAVTHGNRLLMSRYAGRQYKRYALIAGFTEVGETIEETVKREVMEEVGLKVKNLRYYKSQPWSLSDSLLFGFFAELDGSEDITLEEEELAEARWFEREEIEAEYEDFSLTNEMIMEFKGGGFGTNC